MQPTNANAAFAELLEKGQFIITYFPKGVEQKIKGRFTMVAFDRFCEAKNIVSFFDLLKKVAIGMSIGDYADLLLVAFQDYYRNNVAQCEVTRENVLDIIDELGGVGEEFLKIIMHGVGRINGGVDTKKKMNPPLPLPGGERTPTPPRRGTKQSRRGAKKK